MMLKRKNMDARSSVVNIVCQMSTCHRNVTASENRLWRFYAGAIVVADVLRRSVIVQKRQSAVDSGDDTETKVRDVRTVKGNTTKDQVGWSLTLEKLRRAAVASWLLLIANRLPHIVLLLHLLSLRLLGVVVRPVLICLSLLTT
jgi:hypothetical protein